MPYLSSPSLHYPVTPNHHNPLSNPGHTCAEVSNFCVEENAEGRVIEPRPDPHIHQIINARAASKKLATGHRISFISSCWDRDGSHAPVILRPTDLVKVSTDNAMLDTMHTRVG